MEISNIRGEIWKSISGYKGFYEVSSFGRVKSLSKDIPCAKGFRTTNEKILSTKNNSSPYNSVCLYLNKKVKSFKVHQLVAMAFLGHKPVGYKTVVDHINKNKKDNRLSNLQIINQRSNCIRSINKKGKSSKYIGVQYVGGRNLPYVSKIRINNKQIILGKHKTEKEASELYRKKLESVDKESLKFLVKRSSLKGL